MPSRLYMLRLSVAVHAVVAACSLAAPAAAAEARDAGTPQLAALDSSNPNFTEWTLINLTATDVASAKAGAGITVAVLDGPTDCRHADLAGRCSYTLLSGGTYKYYSNHGTHTAGIVAGAKYGIATSATIANYAVFDDKGFIATGQKLASVWKTAYSGGARIASMSFGCSRMALCFSSTEVSAMADAKQPILFVKAAGNDGATLLNESIAVSATTANAALNRTLLVGSVNVTGGISSFSNRPGEACLLASGNAACTEALKWKYHFIVAPGEAIYSTLPGFIYGSMSGTSMATPAVAGVAALLQQRWPTLKSSPETLAKILLATATDLGTPGVDPVYGYGLLNAGRAFQANGTVSLVSPTGTSLTLSGSTVTSTSTMSARLAAVLAQVTVYDAFGRDFTFAESGALQVTPAPRVARQLLGRRLLEDGMGQWADAFFSDEPRSRSFASLGPASDSASAALGYDRSMRMGVDVPFKGGLAQLRVTGAGDPRQDFSHDATMRPLAWFASSSQLQGATIGSVTMAMPGNARLVAYGIMTSGDLSLRYDSAVTQAARDNQNAYFGTSLERDSLRPSRTGIGAGYWKRPDGNTIVGFNASAVLQRRGYQSLTGDLPLLQRPSKVFNLGAAGIRKSGKWQISLSGELSHVRMSRGLDGLAITPATLASAELGLRRHRLVTGRGSGLTDSLALTLAVPPRAVSGSLRVDYMTPTADGLDRRPTSLVVPVSALGHEPARVEGAYRIGTPGQWALDLTGGVELERVAGLRGLEGMASFRAMF